ncbi:hypothetical protein LCGC14_0630790 [marine sediment metagenome]|uniref:Uncharacterized protein n=1 Tax=marine sediment metagenome TaxID=412755 RepID=A0A0F9RLI7_9ZZZZ
MAIENQKFILECSIPGPRCLEKGMGRVTIAHPEGVDVVSIGFSDNLVIDRGVLLSPEGVRDLRDMLNAYIEAQKALNG